MSCLKGICFFWIFMGCLTFIRCHTQSQNQTDSTTCDFIIVGAGTASLALGGILSEVPYWRVCIFERGPMETKMNGWYTNSYKFTSPHDPVWLTNPTLKTIKDNRNKNKDGRNIYIPRFRGRGGTSRVYGAINRRASPGVLNLWPQGWKHDDLTPYYKKMEDHYCYYDSENTTGISAEECKKWHGKGGAVQVNTQMKEAFQKFAREMQYLCENTTMPWNGYAHDYNGPLEGRISCSVFQQFKLRTGTDLIPTQEDRRNRASQTARGSSFTGYYQHRENKPDLYVSSTVTKILFENGKAVGVLSLNAKTHQLLTFRARKEVILGGGSFDTPHLLQVSGVGPRKLLKKIKVDVVADNPHVGQHLWDHISVPYVLKLTPESDDLCCPSSDNDNIPTVNIDGKIYETSKLSSINGPFSWILHLRSNLSRIPVDMSDIQLYVMGNSKLFDETGSLCTATADEIKEYNYNGDEDYGDVKELNEGTIRIIDQWPEYRGSVNAVTSNIFDKPKLDYGWSYTVDGEPTEEFKKVSQLFRDQIRMLRNMFFGDDVRDDLRALIVDEVAPGKEIDTDEELNAWMRGMFVSALHPIGTCKMPDCLDEFLQVKGVSKLRVCDASAFATQTDGNPVATLFAMAEKLADMLKFQYLKHIKVAVRQDLFIPVEKERQNIFHKIDSSLIQSKTNCIDISVADEWIPTGKYSSALIYKWSLVCSGDSNERNIADMVTKATLDLNDNYGRTANSFPLFNRQDVRLINQESTPTHKESSFIFLTWCQVFETVSPNDLWKKVGAWHGQGGKVPGSENCFKLNCQEEICSILQNVNDGERELTYYEPNFSFPVTDYISTKKVVPRNSGKSSAYIRTGSMKSNSGAEWNKIADDLLENVYAISGQRLSRQYPPLDKQDGWWTERKDGLLYYETKGIRSSPHVAAFDLDGTLIKTKTGENFPKDENDWLIKFTEIPLKLQKNQNKGINNVIMSNQKGIGLGYQSKAQWMTKIENIISELGVPMHVLAAVDDNKYRKPKTGMWDFYSCSLNQFRTIDQTKAVYVGDAAGRATDHGDSDQKFAENVRVNFYTPENYFLPPSNRYHDEF